MKDNNLQDTKKSDKEWNEEDILENGAFSMSNMASMVSLSSIYMPNSNNIAINSTDVLSQIPKEKNGSNK